MEEKEEVAVGVLNDEEIRNLIYTVRGKQVMLDSDVAKLYHCETKYINRVVKRNIDRFPEDFCFQLTDTEYENLRCQFVTSSYMNNYGGRRYLPYVFTEHGITMLAGLLKTNIAVAVSIKIVKAFVKMRNFIQSNRQVFERFTTIEYRLLENEKNINKVFNLLQKKKSLNKSCFLKDKYGIAMS